LVSICTVLAAVFAAVTIASGKDAGLSVPKTQAWSIFRPIASTR
jgi:hypothetical protein